MDSRDVFIHNLNMIMKERKVSRKELAKGLNIPYTTLTDWCTGRIFPRVEKINMIADYFGIKKSDLIEEMLEDEDDLLNDDTVIVDVFSKIYFGNILSDKTNVFKVGEIMAVYKDPKPTKNGRAWYFKFSYKDAFGATKQYRSKRYLTKKEASDAERMFLVTSTNKVEDNNMNLKIYMMNLECIMMK